MTSALPQANYFQTFQLVNLFMNELPMVSIILPVYNVELYLEECLDSVLQQTYSNYELIAVNDGSKDRSRDILIAYEKKFLEKLIVIDQENKGLSAARNTGLEHANGTYIYFLDSDDWILPDTLSSCISSLRKNDADLVVFNAKAFCDGMPEEHLKKLDYTRNLPSHTYKSGIKLFEDSRSVGTYIVQSCCYMYRKDVNRSLRFIEGILHEDHFFTTALFLGSNKIEVLQERFFQRRIRQNSITTSSATMKHAEGYYKTAEALHERLLPISKESDELRIYLNYLVQAGFKIERNISENKIGIKRKMQLIKRYHKMMSIKDYPWILFPEKYKNLKLSLSSS